MWSSSKPIETRQIDYKKPLIKTVVINVNLITANQFTYDITNVTFNPDEFIVKGVVFKNTASTGNTFVITSDLTDWNPLAYFSISSLNLINCNVRYTLDKLVNGTYTFNLSGVGAVTPYVSGSLVIHLEFIKY